MELGRMFFSIGANGNEALKIFKEMDKQAKESAEKIKESINIQKPIDEFTKEVDRAKPKIPEMEPPARSALDKVKESLSGVVFSLKDMEKMANDIGSDMVKTFKNVEEQIHKVAEASSKATVALGSGLQSIGNNVTKYVTKPILGVATAMGGLAIGKGFQRLIGIDEARAKLTALKLNAQEVDDVMSAALASVKGTAFGMGEAATTAAGAFAAGIQESKDLERYLKSVGNTAAIAGSSMQEMGAIFNKVATSGKASNMELQQLAQRGIPIYDYLADSIGKTTEEVFEMASRGEIDLATFRKAIEDNIGGAAAIMGATSFKAAFANVGAAIGRVGANFLYGDGEAKSFFETVKRGLAMMIELLEPVEEIAKDFGLVFGQAFGKVFKQFEKFADKFSQWSKEQQKGWILNKTKMLSYVAAIGPLLVVMGKIMKISGKVGLAFTGLGSSILGSLASFGALGAGLGLIVIMLGLLPKEMQQAMKNTLATAREYIPQVVSTIQTELAERLPEAIKNGFSILTDIFNTLEVAVDGAGAIVKQIIDSITQGMKESDGAWADAAVSLVMGLGNAVGGAVGSLTELGITLLTQIANSIGENAEVLIEGFINVIRYVAEWLQGEDVGALNEAGSNMIKGLAQAIIDNKNELQDAAKMLLEALANFLKENWMIGVIAVGFFILNSFVTALISNLPQLLLAGAKWLSTLVAGLLGAKGLLVAAIITLVLLMINSIDWGKLMEAGRQMVRKMIDGVIDRYNEFVDWGKRLVEGFRSKVQSVSLFSAGRGIISGLWNGMQSLWGSVTSWFSDSISWLRDRANAILSINSPSRVFRSIGSSVMEGLDVGMEKRFEGVKRTLDRSINTVIDTFDNMKLPERTLDFDAQGNVMTSLQIKDDLPALEEERAKQAYLMELQEETVDLLRELVKKDSDIYIDETKITEKMAPLIDRYKEIEESRKNKRRGVRFI